jgi:GT2 family glycosyltransferase
VSSDSQFEELSQGRLLPHQRVSAILVSHNGARWLPEVVAALSSQERAPDFLLAVDTGSRDGSVELLRNSRIDVLPAPVDAGFGSAVALAVSQLPPALSIDNSEEGSEREVEWLWLLHDDCAPAPDALASLLSAVAERPNVGVAGPKILGWHDRSHLLEIGVTIAHNGARWTGLERNERDQGQHDGDGVIPVLAVSTAGALIRRDLFEEIGGFDSNLPLFRDDVDFGMRAQMAGYSVLCVTRAKLFHAEAAATERRAIDVAGGTFHRPHLLDRRHAAFVLLANLPLWTLPWIALRVFASSLIRAVGYLLVKLPGYALDEIGAVALLFTRLDRLRSARNARRKKRLLPARVIRPLLAPWNEQIRLGYLRVRDLLLRRIERLPEPVAGNVFTETDETYEGELLAPVETNFWRHTFSRPLVMVTLPLILLALIAGRFRFGPLAGGALAQVGDSAFAYLEFYGQSWHAFGLGSAKPGHPLTSLLALLSLSTGANPALFITIVFLLAPVLALLSMYYFLRKINTQRWLAIAASVMYASSALLVTSINAGFVSTLLLLVLLPFFALIALPVFDRNSEGALVHLTWRRISAITISLAVISAISFQIFIGATLALLIHLAYLKHGAVEVAALPQRSVKYAVVIVGAFFALAPWSLANLFHPGALLMDQGVPAPIASPLHAILGNFLPFNQAPPFVISATALIGVVALFSTRAYIDAIAIFGALFLAALTSTLNVSAAGNSLSNQVWPGGFLALSTFFASRAMALLGEGRVRRLRSSSLGRNHFATIAVTLTTCYCIATNLFWWVSSADNAPVRTVASSVLPPFIATATENPDRPKTLILSNQKISNGERMDVQSFSYVVLRERDARFGELASAPDEIPLLTKTVGEITSGAGDAPAAILADFGIRYLYLENGRRNNSLARKIDGIGGLTRLSATAEGILWEVSGLTSRIKFLSAEEDADVVEVPSERVGGEFDLSGPGTLSIAEGYDSRWRLLQGGRVLEPKKSDLGLVQFDIPTAGRAVLFHDGTLQRAGISLQVAIFGLLLFFALPRGRKQSELSDEEVS